MIINCPECSKEISDQAETCPHCGITLKSLDVDYVRKLKKKYRSKHFFHMLNGILAIISLFAFAPAFIVFALISFALWLDERKLKKELDKFKV